MTYVGQKEPIPQTEEGITKVEWKTQTEINDEVLPNTFKNIKLILSEVFNIKKVEIKISTFSFI